MERGARPRNDDRSGRIRVVIENLTPAVDGGRFALKRVIGEAVNLEADAFTDGHDAIRCIALHRPAGTSEWSSVAMVSAGNDRWRATFVPGVLGEHEYCVRAWVDALETWRRDLVKRERAGQELSVDLLRGAQLAREIAARATGTDSTRLREWADSLADARIASSARFELAQSEAMHEIAARHPDPQLWAVSAVLPLTVDRERARYSTWYELFPRSTGAPGKHGSFADCAARLPAIAAMGFDIVYFPPIHPIGISERKGPNNAAQAGADDPGSPWAIGGQEGGHTAVHPQLGTLRDFDQLVAQAEALGLEIALDLAFQCSPDHPYVHEHPEWFLKRPDGTIQYAENPPKKYQDIVPFHFETSDWASLWEELRSVVKFWIGHGVRVFRVDNPHTKPFGFWEWLIREIRREHPETIFLAEAFTRPRVMERLAKLGFTQSYTYFTWRNTRQEIEQYFRYLSTPPVRDYFRPNLWPNTPDILPEILQFGGRPAFMARLVLAATLGASYGIYGPAFELLEHEAREPGSEEYRDSEKYQLRQWDLTRADTLAPFLARINRIRREHPALQSDRGLCFHSTDNDMLVCYSKSSEGFADAILTVVNLDPHHAQSGWLEINLDALGLSTGTPFQVHDLLSESRFIWHGARNFVALDPRVSPAHVLQLRRRARSERDFDYFL